jgi:hypothetical protein
MPLLTMWPHTNRASSRSAHGICATPPHGVRASYVIRSATGRLRMFSVHQPMPILVAKMPTSLTSTT